MKRITKEFTYGQHQVILETGVLARQATGAVLVRMGETVVLVSVVGRSADGGSDFFPLTVNYQERTYAVGKIPGGFLKREGKPSDRETLTCRLIDRPVRPLFPKGFVDEVQVIATVMSVDPDIEPDIAAIIGTSAALSISGLPFKGPIGAARVGYKDGEFVLNPSLNKEEAAFGQLDLVVSGTENAVLMVESEAKELPESVMLDAVMFGHEQQQVVIKAINEFVAEVVPTPWQWVAPESHDDLEKAVADLAKDGFSKAYAVQEKQERYQQLSELRKGFVSQLADDDKGWDEGLVQDTLGALEKRIVRDKVLSGEKRIDGRDTKTVRPIQVETGVLPRAHGSATFCRGETQAIVVVTLGCDRDAQLLDDLGQESKDRFMMHYNFPPYCVGETGFVGAPKRREIGHGRLAKRGVMATLPSEEDFPYVLRIVSEITDSNGSSSMASVCGSSLALMDAGVPVKAPVAGIAMGLIKEDDNFVVLTDILGDEDHLGDMDFKVAGTATGVTALQMDIKIDGITREIMEQALTQAHDGRLHILGEMNKAIEQPRTDLSMHAPRMVSFKINPDKIRDVIGKGGATIRTLTEETGTTIDIDDDGTVKVFGVDGTSSEEAIERIKLLTAEAEEGAVYDGTVSKITDFGAFVTILPGKDGLLHISQICEERLDSVRDRLSEGQQVTVKVTEIDKQGRLRLSMRDL